MSEEPPVDVNDAVSLARAVERSCVGVLDLLQELDISTRDHPTLPQLRRLWTGIEVARHEFIMRRLDDWR